MKKIALLLLISLAHCFTVYTKDGTVLGKEKFRTQNVKEQKDVYILTHTLNKEGLFLLLDAYRVEEDNQINFIREQYKENRGVKFSQDFNTGFGGCDIYICGAILAVSIGIMLIEIPTLPFRVMSEPKERIQKETQTNSSRRIGIVSTENITFISLEGKKPNEYKFEDDKVFIPLEKLDLDSFISKKFPYKLIYNKNKSVLLKGDLDFSEYINADKEISVLIQENDNIKNSANCKFEFPILRNQDITFNQAESECVETCKKKYSDPKVFVWKNLKYNECMQRIKDCYEATRLSE